MFCGYGPEPLVRAVSDRIARGNQFLLPTEDSIVVSEALANVIKHADATQVEIVIARSDGILVAEIADDGRGLGSPRIDSYGLDIMRERAQRLGVALRVRERHGGGTVIEIALGSAQLGSIKADAAVRADVATSGKGD